jgi:hypothetical protein
MSQQEQHASELDHAEEIGGVPFPSRGESAEVLQQGEQPFNLPAAQIPPQWSAIVSFSSFAPIGSDHFDAMLILEPLIQRIAVVRFKQIGHAFYLQPIGSTRKCLFDRFVGEMGSSP